MKKALILLVLFLACSCAMRRQVEQTHQTSSHDSIVTKYVERIDSVYVDRWHSITQSGDTIYKTDSVVCYKYLWRNNTDTAYICKTDTLLVSTVTTKEVRKANRFTLTCTILFFVLLIAFVALLWTGLRKR